MNQMSDKKEIISKEKKRELVLEIKSFFLDNRDEEIGDLQAEILVDFLIEKVGAQIYNQGLHDAKAWFANKLGEIEPDFYTLERK